MQILNMALNQKMEGRLEKWRENKFPLRSATTLLSKLETSAEIPHGRHKEALLRRSRRWRRWNPSPPPLPPPPPACRPTRLRPQAWYLLVPAFHRSTRVYHSIHLLPPLLLKFVCSDLAGCLRRREEAQGPDGCGEEA
jgi:hypothetical protein